MPRSTPVHQLMTPLESVVAFRPEDKIEDAARAMSDRSIGGAPVVDADGRVIGMIADDDLIVQETRLHFPTVISVLGAYLTLPWAEARFEEDLRKAVGATVGDVMDPHPVTCTEDATVEEVATTMHDRQLSRLPVVRDGRLVGIIARGDLIRALLAPGAPEGAEDGG